MQKYYIILMIFVTCKCGKKMDMNMEFEITEKKISVNDILEFEIKNKLQLPNSYKKFILKNNGGYTGNLTYEQEFTIGSFYSIKYGESTIDNTINILQIIEDTLPPIFIPIADDWGGNIYCISKKDGKIYLWFHDTDNEAILICESFEGFVEGLEVMKY